MVNVSGRGILIDLEANGGEWRVTVDGTQGDIGAGRYQANTHFGVMAKFDSSLLVEFRREGGGTDSLSARYGVES